jgi:hypothetical protein
MGDRPGIEPDGQRADHHDRRDKYQDLKQRPLSASRPAQLD